MEAILEAARSIFSYSTMVPIKLNIFNFSYRSSVLEGEKVTEHLNTCMHTHTSRPGPGSKPVTRIRMRYMGFAKLLKKKKNAAKRGNTLIKRESVQPG